MGDKFLSMFFANKLFVRRYYNIWATYGKFVKWTAYGLYTLGALELCIVAYWYCTNPPPNDVMTEANQPVAGGSGIRAPRRRLTIFRGPYGDVDIPALDDLPAMEAYLDIHIHLSQIYLEQGNENRSSYHSALLLFCHPDPMEFLRLQSTSMPRHTHELVTRTLTHLMSMMENQIREEE